MAAILELLGKVYPLYLLITLGFVVGKLWRVGRKQLAFVIIYVLGPLVIFHGTATAPQGNNVVAVPALFWLMCSFLAGMSYLIGSRLWKNKGKADMLAFMGGTANMGSFGIPMVLAFFGEQAVSIAIYSVMANIVFENTVGYYVLVKEQSHFLQALRKVLALPAIYAFGLGVFVNHVQAFPMGLQPTFGVIRLLLICSGMLLIGLSLATVKRSSLDSRFIATVSGVKFLLFPASMGAVLLLDATFVGVFTPFTRQVVLLLSTMPIGSNIIAFATKLDKHPRLASFTVLVTVLIASIYIPLFAAVFIT